MRSLAAPARRAQEPHALRADLIAAAALLAAVVLITIVAGLIGHLVRAAPPDVLDGLTSPAALADRTT
jgi:hypothetical protein